MRATGTSRWGLLCVEGASPASRLLVRLGGDARRGVRPDRPQRHLLLHPRPGDGVDLRQSAGDAGFGSAYLAVSLTTLVGADSGSARLQYHDRRLERGSRLRRRGDVGPRALVRAAGWTLGVEILFYLLVLFFLRRMWVLLLVVVASLAFRGVLVFAGFAGALVAGLLPSELVFCRRHHRLSRLPDAADTLRAGGRVMGGAARHAGSRTVGVAVRPDLPPHAVHQHGAIRSSGDVDSLLVCRDARVSIRRRSGDLAYPVYIVHLLMFDRRQDGFEGGVRQPVRSGGDG